jgi:beta-lactamase superfamily II metal-dependent hydrolase
VDPEGDVVTPPPPRKPAPVVGPIPDSTLAPVEPPPGALLRALAEDPAAMVYFLLNVGDGDTQLILLPPDSGDGVRRLAIVDVATSDKLPALIEALHRAADPTRPSDPDRRLIEPPGSPGQIRLLVATHPHYDHIGGMSDLLERYNGPNGCIDQFLDPGFYVPTPSFHHMMAQLEASPWVRRLQPTSGTTLYLDSVQITALGPGIGLRNRFDTYGIGINDSSITLMITYPATAIFAEPDPSSGRSNRRTSDARGRRLLLGGDAQFTSWAQATIDFPALAQEQNPALAKELRAARGKDYLKADLFKLSHHASKHGINLELLERVGASTALVSSVAGGGRYGFPHLLAMEAAREAKQATASNGEPRQSDDELGIHITGSRTDTGHACGSIAVLVPSNPNRQMQLFRLMDTPKAKIKLDSARLVRAATN